MMSFWALICFLDTFLISLQTNVSVKVLLTCKSKTIIHALRSCHSFFNRYVTRFNNHIICVTEQFMIVFYEALSHLGLNSNVPQRLFTNHILMKRSKKVWSPDYGEVTTSYASQERGDGEVVQMSHQMRECPEVWWSYSHTVTWLTCSEAQAGCVGWS